MLVDACRTLLNNLYFVVATCIRAIERGEEKKHRGRARLNFM